RLAPWSSLVPLQTKGAKPPFFWVHGEASDVYLPRFLDSDQPLYGFIHQSEDGQPARYTSVEGIAEHYLDELRIIQPRGPYFLGGYCFGALVVFEMAQQLRNQGECVGLLMLLAPSSPQLSRFCEIPRDADCSPKQDSFGREFSRHFHNLESLGACEKAVYVWTRLKVIAAQWLSTMTSPLRKVGRKAAFKLHFSLRRPLPISFRSPYILEVYRQAIRRYTPTSYEGSAVLFLHDTDGRDSRSEWNELVTGGLEVFQFPGNHTGILQESNGRLWAGQLRILLEAAQRDALSPAGRPR